jgi:hypothetical protein
MEKNKFGEIILTHYEKFMGQPVFDWMFRLDDDVRSLQILGYDQFFRNSVVLASFGLSKFDPELGDLAEVYCPVDGMVDEAAEIFANTLFYLIQNRMAIGRGISICGVSSLNADFAARTGKAALYLGNAHGVPDGFPAITCEDEICYMYTMAFISENEHNFFVEHGADALEDLFDSKAVDPIELMRPSCI